MKSNNLFLQIIGYWGFRKIRIIFVFIFFFILILFIYKYNFINFAPKISEDYNSNIEEIMINRMFDGEIYFNYIGDGGVFEKLLFSMIEKTKESIDIAIYSIKYPLLIEILSKKKKEGVDIRVIVPKSKEKQHQSSFKNTDFFVKTLGKNDNDFMHHKFLIVDVNSTEPKILFGSTNFTYIQFKYDSSFMLLSSDVDFIKYFSKEFERLEDGIFGYRKLFKEEYKPLSVRLIYNNGFIEPWFSPGYKKYSIKYRIIDLINSAEKSIKIIGWRINDKQILKALIEKMKQGIMVQVLVDDYYFYDEYSIADDLRKFQKELNLKNTIHSDSFYNLVFDLGLLPKDENIGHDFNSFLHQHLLIVDDEILVQGTSNWSFNGFYANDESVIVTDIKNLVNESVSYFDYLKSELIGLDLDVEFKNEKLIFKKIPEGQHELILYQENSYPSKHGNICFRIKISNNQEILLPKECTGFKTRYFVVDKNNKLISGFY
jgi:phosphatidylserine/phosphatidylglycerophosphate/cardiolipin synthase-like enzyme